MTGRTHDTAAFTFLLAAVAFHPPGSLTTATLLLAILANQIGGIAPDIDQPTAPLWRNLPVGGLFGRTIDRLLGGHRFITHSLLGVWALGWLANFLLHFFQPVMPHVNITVVWWAFMLGVVSHLVMDSFTKEGVPWLLPIPVKFGIPPLKALRVTTGHFWENFVIFPALLVLNIIVCYGFYPTIATFIHSHVKQ